ncbi:hypothetical protein [Nocardia sp. NPDC002869]|uniref:hypothetical protein n=1 Tax=Nocardia sp. NPDC002869 TaxID=3161032 RepID=UPI00398D4271
MALQVLADDRFDYAWADCAEILRRAAPWVFDDLVGVLANDPPPTPARRLRRVLGVPAEERPLELSPRSADSMIHCQWWPCGRHGELVAAHRCQRLPVLVTLLASSYEEIRGLAVKALVDFGPGMVAVMQEVRRSRCPSRRAALAVLAEFGWQNLDPADLAALHRLIRIKQRTETPRPLPQIDFASTWYALPTTDQAAVLTALDLHDPVPATMRMGFAPWQGFLPQYVNTDAYELDDPHRYWRSGLPQVFVTPALDGWTLVLWEELLTQSDEEMYRRVERLSRRFGAAHRYCQFDSGHGYSSDWCVAESGAVRIHCGCYDGEVVVHRSAELSPSMPAAEAVRDWLAAHDHGKGHRPPKPAPVYQVSRSEKDRLRARFGKDPLPPAEEDHRYAKEALREWECGVQGAAWRLSISPDTFGLHTRVQGTGVLAVPATRRGALRRGRLPI